MIGDLVDAVVGHVGDYNARFGRSSNINVVHPHAKPRNDPASHHLANHLAGNLSISDEHSIGVSRHRQDGIRWRLFGEAQLGIAFREKHPGWIQVRKGRVGNGDERVQHGQSAMASAMCSISVNTTGPLLETRTFSSSRAVCCSPGCPAKVSIAKYIFSLISAGKLRE